MNAMQMENRALRAENARLKQMLMQKDATDRFLSAALGGYCGAGVEPAQAAELACQAADALFNRLTGPGDAPEAPAEETAAPVSAIEVVQS